MPYGDGTGPEGMGPLTGRGLGYCVDPDVAGIDNSGGGRAGYGRAFGRGAGRGRGRGRGAGPRGRYVVDNAGVQPDVSQMERQIEMLQSQLDNMKKQLGAARNENDV